jgi:hypothetical protein
LEAKTEFPVLYSPGTIVELPKERTVSMTWTGIQHPTGHPPRVTAANGTVIPIPESVHGDGGRVFEIPASANVRVGNEGNERFEVEINIPSRMSGDTRMVLAAAGVSSAGAVANAQMRMQRISFLPRFVLGQVVKRVAAVVVGVMTPNEPCSEIFLRRRLDSGAPVRYVILAQVAELSD